MDYFYKYKVYKYKDIKGGNEKRVDIPKYLKKLGDILLVNRYILDTLQIDIPQLLDFLKRLLEFYNLLIINNYRLPEVDISNKIIDIGETIDDEDNIKDKYQEILDRVKVNTKLDVGEDDEDFARRMSQIQNKYGGGKKDEDKKIREYVQYFKKNLPIYRKYLAILLLLIVLHTQNLEEQTDLTFKDFIWELILLAEAVYKLVKNYIIPVITVGKSVNTGIQTIYGMKRRYWDDLEGEKNIPIPDKKEEVNIGKYRRNTSM